MIENRDDFTYLADFGISQVIGKVPAGAPLTTSGVTVGTLAYLAPERLLGGSDVDGRADVYSLACVLFETLTGRAPYPFDDVPALVAAHLYTPPPRVTDVRRDLSPVWDALIARGMAKDVSLRHATPRELATAARAALTPSRVGDRPPATWQYTQAPQNPPPPAPYLPAPRPPSGPQVPFGPHYHPSGQQHPSGPQYPAVGPPPAGLSWSTPYPRPGPGPGVSPFHAAGQALLGAAPPDPPVRRPAAVVVSSILLWLSAAPFVAAGVIGETNPGVGWGMAVVALFYCGFVAQAFRGRVWARVVVAVLSALFGMTLGIVAIAMLKDEPGGAGVLLGWTALVFGGASLLFKQSSNRWYQSMS